MFLQNKKKDRDADISETDLVTGFFPTLSDNILPTEKLLRLRCDLRLRLSSIDEESISFPESALLCQPERAKGSRPLGTRLMKSGRHFDAFHWEPMKLSQINHVIW